MRTTTLVSKFFSLTKACVLGMCVLIATEARAEFGVSFDETSTFGCVNCYSSPCSSPSSSCYKRHVRHRYVQHSAPHHRTVVYRKRSTYNIKVYRVEQVNPCACSTWVPAHCNACGGYVPGHWSVRNGSYIIVEDRYFNPDLRTADDTGAELSTQ